MWSSRERGHAVGGGARYFLSALALALFACGGGGGEGQGDGGAGNDGGTNTASIAGTWLGPARIGLCTGAVSFPGQGNMDRIAPVQLTIGNSGLVEEVLVDGQSFSTDPADSFYPEIAVVEPDYLELRFPNVDEVPTDFPSEPLELPGVHGGGLLVQRDDSGAPKYAFVFVHDLFGCDLIVGVLERGAQGLPTYDLAQLDGSWSGRSLQFTDETQPFSELNLRFDGSQSPWNLEIDGGGGTGAMKDKGQTLSLASASFTHASGDFEGRLVEGDGTAWVFSGLLSPDQDFFAGFVYLEEWDGHWHDVLLTRNKE